MLHCLLGSLLAGGVAGAATDRKRRRPFVRAIMKGGIAAGHKIETASAAVLAESRKLVDEARAELDGQETERRN